MEKIIYLQPKQKPVLDRTWSVASEVRRDMIEDYLNHEQTNCMLSYSKAFVDNCYQIHVAFVNSNTALSFINYIERKFIQ